MGQFHSVKNLSIALNVEASELLEIYQWMKEEVSNRVTDNPKTMEKIEDEIADILIYLLRVVDKTNMNLGKAVYNKMEKNAEKYPVELASGNAKKYSDFE